MKSNMLNFSVFKLIVVLLMFFIISEKNLFANSNNRWIEVKKLTASDENTNYVLGCSVATRDNVAVVGAAGANSVTNNTGAAYIYERNYGGTTNWGQVKKIIASDANLGDSFGRVVDVAGNVVLIGAPNASPVLEREGAAYIFERNVGGTNNWGQIKRLVANDANASDNFGGFVAVAGDVIAVGADEAVYIFERNTGGTDNWGQVKKLTASDADVGDYFGCSVDVESDVIVVGAPYKDSTENNAGAAYIFERNAGGTNNWGQVKEIVSSDTESSDAFATSVSVAGDVIAVGAIGGGYWDLGKAYIFERNRGGTNNWGEVKKLVALDLQPADHLGVSIAVEGDKVMVGTESEAVYVFERNAGGIDNWNEIKKVTAMDAHDDDYFGETIALSGDIAIIGAHGNNNYSGAAYIIPISLETKDFQEITKKTASDAEQNDYFGNSVAIAGDVAVAGAPREDSGGADAGAAYIFERSFNGINSWNEVRKLTASDAQPDDWFGHSIAAAGDVVISGAYCEDSGGNNAGAAYIFERNFGGINSWGEVKKIVADDAQESDYFGYSVSVAEDVAIVGATGEDTAASGAGAAYIFERNFCGTNLWNQVKKLVASDAQASDHFGWSVAVAGDVAVVGAAYEDSGGNNSGAAYVFERNANGGTNNWGQVKKLVPHDSQENGYFGYSVAVAGDVIIVGAYGKSSYTGAAYVFERNANGGINNWGEVRKLTASDAQANSYFGWSVAVEGDKIIVGEYNENVGAAYMFERDVGGMNLWNEVKKLQSSEIFSNSYFGNSVAMAGDVAIIGSYLENSVNRKGAAYIFEYLEITDPIRSLILMRKDANTIKDEARRLGMKTLREDGWSKVKKGITTVAEVLRVTQQE